MQKFTLKEPIKQGSEIISELEMRKPKAKDFRGMPVQPGVSDLLDLAGRLCAQPKSIMDELGVEDVKIILQAVSDFL